MPYNDTDAIDELFAIAKAAFDANQAILGYALDIRWPGQPGPDIPDPSKTWARVSAQIVTETQTSLGNSGGKRRFTSTGMLHIQVFASRSAIGEVEKARQLSQALRDAYRSEAPSGVMWFRQQKMVELPSTDEFYPFNVVAVFEFESIK